jgi:hypothetical protein
MLVTLIFRQLYMNIEPLMIANQIDEIIAMETSGSHPTVLPVIHD